MQKYLPGIRPCSIVYLLLILLSVLTWSVGVMGLDGLTVVLLVLGFSLLKGYFIGEYYMGLKRVSSAWRYVIPVWLLVTGSLISVAFYLSSGG